MKLILALLFLALVVGYIIYRIVRKAVRDAPDKSGKEGEGW